MGVNDVMNIAGVIARLPISEQLVATKAFALVGVRGRGLEDKTGPNKRGYGDAGVGPAFERCEARVFLRRG